MEDSKIRIAKDAFINKMKGSLTDNYDIIEKLGEGETSKVYIVKSKKSGELRACKQISGLKVKNLDLFKKEIEYLKILDHPNIIKIYEYYESKRSIYIILELCKGGDLLDRMIKRIKNGNKFTEKDVANIFLPIMKGIEYCHKKGICHRDISPKNIMYPYNDDENNNTENSLKIIDFGLSKCFENSNKLKTKVGSSYYIAKEVLEGGEYSEKCDIWSAGVLLYYLLSGNHPFNGNNEKEIYSKIKECKLAFLPAKKWGHISSEAIDLINHMITDQDKRFNASQVLSHIWFKKCHTIKEVNLHFESQCFSEYQKVQTFKKVVLLFIASRLSNTEVGNLQDVFKDFDKNNDGLISLSEFEQGLYKCKVDKNEIDELFKSIDIGGKGSINYTEFMAACMEKKIYLKKEKLYEVFSMFDKDDSGTITKEELMQVLAKENINIEKKVDELMEKIDKDHDGVIDYKEFVLYME